MRREGVCQCKDGEVAAGRVGGLYYALEELEVANVGGEAEAAAVVPDEDVFGILVADPVALGTFAEVDCVWG